MAFAWSGLFVACLCSLKRSQSVPLVSPIQGSFPSPRLHTCPGLPLNRFSACGVIKYSFPDVSIYFINAGFENRIASGVEREKLIFCQRPGNSNFK